MTSATFLLAVGVLGLATSVVHQRSLERSTNRLWAGTTAAASAMEDIRAAADANWDETTAWNGWTVDPKVARADTERLRAVVTDDAAALSTPDGMWSTGATEANFYYVHVDTAAATAEFANTLTLQTYVADRTGIRTAPLSPTTTSIGDESLTSPSTGDELTSPSTGDSDATESSFDSLTSSSSEETLSSSSLDSDYYVLQPVDTDTRLLDAATYVSTQATDVAVTGTSTETLSFSLTSSAPTSLSVTSAEVEVGDEGLYSYVQISFATFYDGVPDFWGTLTPSGGGAAIEPGSFTVFIDATTDDPAYGSPFSGQATTLSLTFSDGSTASITVTPRRTRANSPA